jgi:lantibiotic modifying enzyme
LRQRLVQTGNQAARWEIAAAKAGQKLSMELESAARAKFHDYFFYASLSKAALHFLCNYPALARLWAIQIASWVRFVRTFLHHTSAFAYHIEGRADEPEIRDNHWKFSPVITRLKTDLSDSHGGNRTVVRVRFAKDNEWFYKPRSGLQERAWFELLGWINSRGFVRSFQILRVMCEDRHCWMTSVRPRACRNRKEVEDYGFRLGALICLIHILRGVDFHPANIVGVGDQPIVIDCETLLHPATALPKYVRAEDDSVARTGMLRLIHRVPLDRIVAGFRAMHDFLRQPSALRYLRHWASRMQRSHGRNVYRPTVHYYEILKGSLSPLVLTNGLERSLCLGATCRIDCPSTRRVRAEIRALENADIPVFRSRRCNRRFPARLL